MRTIELQLEDEVAALLEKEEPLGKAAHETLVMDLFRRGKVSTGRACELLGRRLDQLVLTTNHVVAETATLLRKRCHPDTRIRHGLAVMVGVGRGAMDRDFTHRFVARPGPS